MVVSLYTAILMKQTASRGRSAAVLGCLQGEDSEVREEIVSGET